MTRSALRWRWYGLTTYYNVDRRCAARKRHEGNESHLILSSTVVTPWRRTIVIGCHPIATSLCCTVMSVVMTPPQCVTRVVRALKKAGASTDEIAGVVWRSPYFISRYGQTREKLAAVLRVRLRSIARAEARSS